MEKLNTICNEYRRPNNAVLVVAGDAEPDTVRALAAKTYGRLCAGRTCRRRLGRGRIVLIPLYRLPSG